MLYCNLHHKEYSRYNKSRVCGICKHVSYKGWQILFYGLHDDIIHLFLATGDKNWIMFTHQRYTIQIYIINVVNVAFLAIDWNTTLEVYSLRDKSVE